MPASNTLDLGATAPSSEPSALRPERGRSRTTLASVAVMITGGLIAGAAVVLSPAGPRLSVEPRVDEEGHDRVLLRCPSCTDGMKVTMGGASATFRASAAEVLLPTPLQVGDNAMEAKLRADADDDDAGDTVRVRIPIAFRVRTDLTSLADERAFVQVEAPAKARATVDGVEVPLDAQGHGAHGIDLSAETKGASLETKTIDRRVAYSIELPGGDVRAGTIAVRTSVTPLMVDGPAVGAVVDGAMVIVRGRTLRTASLKVGAQTLDVRSDGSFATEIPVPSGPQPTLVIRAQGAGMAPRTVTVALRRAGEAPKAAPSHGP